MQLSISDKGDLCELWTYEGLLNIFFYQYTFNVYYDISYKLKKWDQKTKKTIYTLFLKPC
jgi:hypothetical protein